MRAARHRGGHPCRVDPGREPDASATRRRAVGAASPGRGRSTSCADDGDAVPDPGARTCSPARGSRPSSSGQKVRWVLEMMNGPEFAGERIGHYDMTEADDGALELTFRGAQPGEPHIDLDGAPGRARATSATRAGRSASGSWRRRCRRRSSPPTTCPASGGGATRSPPGTGPTTAVTSGPSSLDNEHLHVEVDGDGTYAVTTSDGAHGARPRTTGGRRRRRRHLQLLAARRGSRRRPARARRGHGARVGSRARPRAHRRDVPVADARARRRALVLPARRRDRAGRGAHDPRAAHRRTIPPRPHRAGQPLP